MVNTDSNGKVPGLKIGVSACVMGSPVRFDGGHKRSSLVTGVVAEHAELIPVCPEVGIGLGVPRETIRLVRENGEVRLVAPKSALDLTAAMREYAEREAERLAGLGLSGFVLKAGSPTCGMDRVKIYDHNGSPQKSGVGLFAEELKRRLPLLPIEEDGRLNDAVLRENFLERVLAFHRLQTLFAGDWSVQDVIDFHTSEKLLLLAHDPDGSRQLGRLAASVRHHSREDFMRAYAEQFMAIMSCHTTRKSHVVVLQRVLGLFRNLLDSGERQDLHFMVEDLRAGLIPTVVPLRLFRHYARRLRLGYLEVQSYFDPGPRGLLLRNHLT